MLLPYFWSPKRTFSFKTPCLHQPLHPVLPLEMISLALVDCSSTSSFMWAAAASSQSHGRRPLGAQAALEWVGTFVSCSPYQEAHAIPHLSHILPQAFIIH